MQDPHETELDPYGIKDNPEHAKRMREISAFLSEDAPFLRALDVGCSEGAVTAHLARHADTMVGIDVSPVAVERAREEHKDQDGLEFEAVGFLEYAPRRKFDLVILTAVPELFGNTNRSMDALAGAVFRCLKKRGGRLLVSHVKSSSDGDGYLGRLLASGFRAVRSGEFTCGGSAHSIHLLKIG